MKNYFLLIILTTTVFCCNNIISNAQTKKGKTTKPKELIECEKKCDSLVYILRQLDEENATLDKTIGRLETEKVSLIEKTTLLHVSNIKIENFSTGKGNKSELTTRAKDLNKTTILFEFFENENATLGTKTVNVVISDSKGKVIGSQDKKFKLLESGVEKNYTYEGNIEYKKPIEKSKIDIKQAKKFVAEKYKVEIYINGALAGFSEFELE